MTHQRIKQLFAPSKIFFYTLSIVVFLLVIRSLTKFKDIEDYLIQIKPEWLIIAFLAQVLTYTFHALIYIRILGDQKKLLHFFEMFKITITLFFVNQALPTGGISGNGYVFHSFIKRGISKTRAFGTLVYELLCYYITYIILICSYLLWYIITFSSFDNHIIESTLIGGLFFYLFLIGIMTVVSDKQLGSLLLKKFSKMPWITRHLQKASSLFDSQTKEYSGWYLLKKNKEATMMAIILQTGIFILDVLTIYAIMKGFDIEISFVMASFCLLLSLVIGALPLSPGSLIIYESAMVYFFVIMGVPIQAAIIITLLYRFLSFWLPIPIGLLFYKQMEMNIKKIS